MCAVAVQLTKGDLFDGPSDLVALPCSTSGTYTPVVAEKLRRFQIPAPRPAELGHVEIHELGANVSQVAQYAALATSVAAYASTPEAIREIGMALGRATREYPGVSAVNAPLLGAGAGHLECEVVVQELRDGFRETAKDGAVLRIFVLDEDIYERLLESSDVTGRDGAASQGPGDVPTATEEFASRPMRVLLSYAHGTDSDWVDNLYLYLREEGVDARLDRYLLRAGADLMQWMSNEITLADRVLVICDERYAQRADGHHGGVGWEIMLIQGDMYGAMSANGPEAETVKYIPIVRTDDERAALPNFLKTKLFIHWPNAADGDAKRTELLDELFARRREPPLGRPRAVL